METVWTKDYKDYNLESISEDTKTPILIIGGGVAGLMCAYNLMKEKKEFILVDSKKLARGVSAYSTAQVSIGHDNLYSEIKRKHNEITSLEYFEAQAEGLKIIENIILDEKISCDYIKQDTIVHANNEENLTVINDMFKLLQYYGEVALLKDKIKPLNYKLGINFPGGGIFNPVKYMNGIINILIKKNIKLYENSKVTKIDKRKDIYEVTVNGYKILTNKIIMACHYPIKNPDNLYFAKIYQSKSYAVSFKSNIKLDSNYVSLDPPYFYLRTYDKDTLIIGGCDHYTGIDTNNKNYYELLIKEIKRLDKEATIEYRWFTEDCISIDSLPFVGQYSRSNPDIIVVTAFGKWGFTNSHIAAKTVVSLLSNEDYHNIFKTNRWTLLRDLKSTARMISHSLNGLIFSKLMIKKLGLNTIKIDSGKVIKYKGQNVLVYKEEDNKYVFLKNKCTHMGCSLIWNDIDKLWESKCHGSIFDKYGKVIYGPANEDLERLYF